MCTILPFRLGYGIWLFYSVYLLYMILDIDVLENSLIISIFGNGVISFFPFKGSRLDFS